MLTKEENERFTRVGPGTPAGELLRRYWWPIEYSRNIAARPVPVRLLAQDFVLYRAEDGSVAMLDRHCPHRLASLQYGRVEGQNLRCAYHGWLFDRNGRCVEQPEEPAGSTYHEKIQHGAYSVREAGGLIFAYIGPKPVPELPNYALFQPRPGKRFLRSMYRNGNWLQFAENLVDPSHLPWLHASGYPDLATQRVENTYDPTLYGMRLTVDVPGLERELVLRSSWHEFWFFFPAMNLVTTSRVTDAAGRTQNMFCHTPIDDENTESFHMQHAPAADGDEVVVVDGKKDHGRGVYKVVDDGWWGIDSYQEDRIIQESQGIVTDRTQDHLGTSDRGILLFRSMMKDAMKAIEDGRDPINVVRTNERIELGDHLLQTGVLT